MTPTLCDNCKKQNKCLKLFLDLSDQTTECIYSPSLYDPIKAPAKSRGIIKQIATPPKKAYIVLVASTPEALEERVAHMISRKYLPIGGPMEWNENLAQAMLISDDKMRGHSG